MCEEDHARTALPGERGGSPAVPVPPVQGAAGIAVPPDVHAAGDQRGRDTRPPAPAAAGAGAEMIRVLIPLSAACLGTSAPQLWQHHIAGWVLFILGVILIGIYALKG